MIHCFQPWPYTRRFRISIIINELILFIQWTLILTRPVHDVFFIWFYNKNFLCHYIVGEKCYQRWEQWNGKVKTLGTRSIFGSICLTIIVDRSICMKVSLRSFLPKSHLTTTSHSSSGLSWWPPHLRMHDFHIRRILRI